MKDWDDVAISKRSEQLVEDALKIWPYPNLDEKLIDCYKPKKGKADDGG